MPALCYGTLQALLDFGVGNRSVPQVSASAAEYLQSPTLFPPGLPLFALAFFGRSRSGKSELATRLARRIHQQNEIGLEASQQPLALQQYRSSVQPDLLFPISHGAPSMTVGMDLIALPYYDGANCLGIFLIIDAQGTGLLHDSLVEQTSEAGAGAAPSPASIVLEDVLSALLLDVSSHVVYTDLTLDYRVLAGISQMVASHVATFDSRRMASSTNQPQQPLLAWPSLSVAVNKWNLALPDSLSEVSHRSDMDSLLRQLLFPADDSEADPAHNNIRQHIQHVWPHLTLDVLPVHSTYAERRLSASSSSTALLAASVPLFEHPSEAFVQAFDFFAINVLSQAQQHPISCDGQQSAGRVWQQRFVEVVHHWQQHCDAIMATLNVRGVVEGIVAQVSSAIVEDMVARYDVAVSMPATAWASLRITAIDGHSSLDSLRALHTQLAADILGQFEREMSVRGLGVADAHQLGRSSLEAALERRWAAISDAYAYQRAVVKREVEIRRVSAEAEAVFLGVTERVVWFHADITESYKVVVPRYLETRFKLTLRNGVVNYTEWMQHETVRDDVQVISRSRSETTGLAKGLMIGISVVGIAALSVVTGGAAAAPGAAGLATVLGSTTAATWTMAGLTGLAVGIPASLQVGGMWIGASVPLPSGPSASTVPVEAAPSRDPASTVGSDASTTPAVEQAGNGSDAAGSGGRSVVVRIHRGVTGAEDGIEIASVPAAPLPHDIPYAHPDQTLAEAHPEHITAYTDVLHAYIAPNTLPPVGVPYSVQPGPAPQPPHHPPSVAAGEVEPALTIRATISAGGSTGSQAQGPLAGVSLPLPSSQASGSGAPSGPGSDQGSQSASASTTVLPSVPLSTPVPLASAQPSGQPLPSIDPAVNASLRQHLQVAIEQYRVAQATAPNTLGYYGQIVNLLCAATRSDDGACTQMVRYYARYDWAGAYMQSVFDGFLGQSNSVDVARVATMADGQARVLLAADYLTPPSFAAITGADQRDFAALLVGSVHFIQHLYPAFQRYLSQLVTDTDRTAIHGEILRVRTEHANLFQYGVVPGFMVELRQQHLSTVPAHIGQATVPVVARLLREALLFDALVTRYGVREAIDIQFIE